MSVVPKLISSIKNKSVKTSIGICFFVIAMVALFDTWAAAANSEILMEEKNPICVKLLELDPEGKSWFIAAKSFGAAMVLATLGLLFKSGYRHAMLVTRAITTFQVGLLIYLCFSDPKWYGLPNFSLLFGAPESVFILS